MRRHRVSTLALAVALLASCGTDGYDTRRGETQHPATTRPVTTSRTASPRVPRPASNPGTITASEFAQLREGMRRSEVTSIVGSAGELLSESYIGGITTIMVMWDGEGSIGANANAMFQNGQLISKAQFGL